MSDETPEEVAAYFEDMFGSEKNYARQLTNFFFQSATLLLLTDLMRRMAADGEGSPKEVAETVFEGWLSQLRSSQAQVANKHSDMAETVLGKMFSDVVKDGESLRIFFKKSRDESVKMVRPMLDKVVAAAEKTI